MLIQNLQHSTCYPHPTHDIRVIETHISWVILTGEYAYKIKKPVNFGFLDFSTLEKRKLYCEEEFRLGQSLNTHLYLEVLPIVGSLSAPRFEGSGPIIEYALKMKQFPQKALLSEQLNDGKVTDALISTLAQQVAKFHQTTPVAAPDSRFGLPEQVQAPVLQNFEQMLPLEQDSALQARLNVLLHWSKEQFLKWHIIFKERKEKGFIRDCHGDLHLANIIFYENKISLFDRIEFNDDFRWTDVFADIAFLMMDLNEKGVPEFSIYLLNEYLADTGDYQGLVVLPYYFVYRAMVRAKVALFHKTYDKLSQEAQKSAQNTYLRFITLAEHYATKLSCPELCITHGLSGTGKTTLAREWVKKKGALHLRSDVVRKHLHGLDSNAQLNAPVYGAHYTAEATDKTYQKLLILAESILQAGYSVIVDACFLKQAQRTSFYQLAERLSIPCVVLASPAPIDDALKARIQLRHQAANDASEARLDVLEAQIKTLEPLTLLEKDRLLKDITRVKQSIK